MEWGGGEGGTNNSFTCPPVNYSLTLHNRKGDPKIGKKKKKRERLIVFGRSKLLNATLQRITK